MWKNILVFIHTFNMVFHNEMKKRLEKSDFLAFFSQIAIFSFHKLWKTMLENLPFFHRKILDINKK